MKYSIDLKFRDAKICDRILKSYLIVSDEKIYFEIIDNDSSTCDRFMISEKSLIRGRCGSVSII